MEAIPYIVAPAFSAFTALLAFSVIPFGEGWEIGGYEINGAVATVDIGLIIVFALGSIGVYGFIVGGWASESKFSLLGSMRTCAQLVSYEVSLSLSVIGVIMVSESLNLSSIVDKQIDTMWFVVPQFVGFAVYFIAATAETARAPFDLVEADSEIVAGYHTEFSGMRWGLFQMAEYINLIVLSGLAVTLFFGGWEGPWAPLGPLWFLLKLLLAISIFIWIRASVPRLRYDQLMRFGWKVLLPVATLNALVTAAVVADEPRPDRRGPRVRRHLPPAVQEADHRPVPRGRTAGLPALPRAPPAPPARERPGEVRRLLALRGRVPVGLHPRRGRRERAGQPRLPGERYARIYEINMSRCIFCGYCELACPFDAITLGTEYEISEYSRDDLIYAKDMLLAPPIKTVPVADPEEYDIPTRSTRGIRDARRRHFGRRRRRLDRLGRGLGRLSGVGGGGRQLRRPLLLRARIDRQPRLAGRPLSPAVGGVRGRCAGVDLRRRHRRDVPVRDRVRQGPRRRAVGGVAVRPDVGGRSRRQRRSSSRCSS